MYGVQREKKMTQNYSLTPKQKQVLQCIETHLAEHGRPPSYREIAADLGVTAVGTIQDHVRALRSKGYLDSGKRGPAATRHRKPVQLTHNSQARSIPILGTVPAGPPIEAIEERIGSLAFAPTSGSAPHATAELFALRVQGDSMEGAGILEGDYVVVQKSETARNGEIVVALVDGEVTVKRLEIGGAKSGGRMRLMPENPKYKPIEIPAHGINSIQGRVVSVQRFFK